jgi:LPS-assembly protein
MRTPVRLLSLASLLAFGSTAFAADSPWSCNISATGLWECVSAVAPTSEAGLPAAPATGETAGSPLDAPATREPATPGRDTAPAEAPAETAPVPPPPAAAASATEEPAATAEETTDTATDQSAPVTTPATDTPLFPTAVPEKHTPAAPAVEEPAATAEETTDTATSPLAPATMTAPSPAAEAATAEKPPREASSDQPVVQQTAPVPAATGALPEAAAPAADTRPIAATRDGATATARTTSAAEATGGVDEGPDYSSWALCPPVEYRRVDTPTAEKGTVELQADSAQSREGNIFILEGNAVAQMDRQRLEADRLTYDQEAGRIDAEGNMLYTSPDLLVDGERGTFYPDTETGDIEQATYAIPGRHARGAASALELEGRDQQQLNEVSYTTCAIGNNDWLITARQVDLDQETGTGTARDAKVKIRGVPVMYTPYLSFPLDDRRKSGLLIPKVGTTEETGFDISTPYYWNIAPDHDATLVPRYMSKRGLMLGGEFRYKTLNNHGKLSGEYLPSDKDFNNEDRYLIGFDHRGHPVPRLDTAITASKVSDDFYFDDFGTNLVQTSQTNLQRTASADYHGRGWNLGVMAQNFQTIDPTIQPAQRPYEQIPTVTFDFMPPQRPAGLAFGADGEANYFRHSGEVLVDGGRFDILPRVGLPVYRPGWYLNPLLGVRYTTYSLNNTAPGEKQNPSRTTAVVSLDAGSFFDRVSRWGDTDFIQTLEPRLYYLYVPYKNQDDLPVFDTGEYDFNYWTLFRENRFSGPDRMGDANQLALALTSRFLNPANGVELFSVRVGTLLYFRDREVTLPGEPVETSNTSNIIGELTLGLTHEWNARAETQWNPQASQSDLNSIHLQYHKGHRQLVNLSYRYRRGIEDQTDISALWPLGNAWHMVGRWYYSLRDNQTLEVLGGLGYESCCWTAQLVGRSFVKNLDTREKAIFLQVELRGLGRLVDTVDKALERGILGYDSLD